MAERRNSLLLHDPQCRPSTTTLDVDIDGIVFCRSCSNTLGINWSQVHEEHRLANRQWTEVQLLDDGRHEITLYTSNVPKVRTFARDPKIADALADILLEQGATPDCPHCEVIA